MRSTDSIYCDIQDILLVNVFVICVTLLGIRLSRGIHLSIMLVCTSGHREVACSDGHGGACCTIGGSVGRALWNTRLQSPSLCSNLGYARRINIVLWMLMYNQPKSS